MELPVCKTCFRPAHLPKRRIVDGIIIEGCVSAFHTGHIDPNTNASRWHNRPEAKELRRNARFDFNPKNGNWCK